MFSTILQRSEINALENRCFQAGYPVAALMEKAGLKLFSLFVSLYPKEKYRKIGVLAGPGHNGGDALVMARELFFSGYEPVVFDFYLQNKKELTQSHLSYFKEIGGSITDQESELAKCDVLIDGLYGFGLNRSLAQFDCDLIRRINKLSTDCIPVFSIDLPSGLDADLGTQWGECIRATHTACLGAFKQGLFEDSAVSFVGKLHFVSLNYPSSFHINKKNYSADILDEWIPRSSRGMTESRTGMTILKKERNIHKYTNSITLALVGSEKFPGAGILAIDALGASGVGYLYALYTSPAFLNFWQKKPSTVLIEESNIENILIKHKDKKNFSILCGCGIEENSQLVNKLLDFIKKNETACSFVWDAGSFSVLKKHLSSPGLTGGSTLPSQHILTPHLGEFHFLFPEIYEKLANNLISRIEACSLAAQQSQTVIVLKGPHTVIANPDGKTFVNWHSTSALAKAGTGDILAGIITALCSQNIEPFVAACLSVYLHSQIAIQLEKKYGYFAVTPEFIVKKLSSFLFKRLKN